MDEIRTEIVNMINSIDNIAMLNFLLEIVNDTYEDYRAKSDVTIL